MFASAQIAKLQDQGEAYARKIDGEKKRIEELDRQIALIQTQILQRRKEMGGVNATRENNLQVQKQIRILENRLDKALVKFNEALAHNKQLRETIDNLRRERVVFDGIYRKLERELQEKKSKMAQIIEASNAAYEARDQAQLEMQTLKQQADKDQQQFEMEWASLAAQIEKDRRLKDFMKKEREKVPGSGGNSDSVDEEHLLRKRVTKGAWGIAKDKANIHLSMQKVQAYEEAFAKIQKATKITDIDELVATFVNAEDQNFALFNYVNDLSNEIEKLEDNVGQVKADIAKYHGSDSSAPADNQRKRLLEDLEVKLAATEQKAHFYDDRYNTALQTVASLKDGIQTIFNKIGCSSPSVTELLGSAGVTESNMMHYLGIIEQRTNELLSTYMAQRSFVDENNGYEEKQGKTAASIMPTIDAPSMHSDSMSENEDDEDKLPLSHEELQQQVLASTDA